ncbi:MAG: hypothetical protein A2X28_07150 [Elusimicrobia bacterium GWA2_56_46]|nr:MAG: hypothetical protein A2X28_07150 [Elusimicrobia bacterium GWA2_56_46]OGR54778.1 MAG: hypothetical protein A2X39_10840 [Elusimicrobia bacterium GWC2_56_31]HBB67386.1 hypothetical protein [Elusimicrobiota bacterium]HBW23431.1 hypothetical protein [Elusimicrobiota bacterium]
MRIAIINGNPDPENQGFEGYIQLLAAELNSLGNETETICLREMKINHCVGCYSCWLKTPGVCVFNDDGPRLLTEFLKADLAVYASPVLMGFISALLKGAQERFLPLSLPFFLIKDNRLQHIPRYAKYPASAVLLGATEDDISSTGLIENIFKSGRTRRFLFTKTMNTPVKEVANALNDI